MDPIRSFTGESFIFSQNENSNVGLPEELILRIFSSLDINSISQISKSCKKLNRLSNDAELWKHFCVRDFFAEKTLKIENWKNYYQDQLELGYLRIPFPGKSGVFHLDSKKNWKALYSSTLLLREFSFISDTEDSLIRRFNLFGYEKGDIMLSIKVSHNNSDFQTYLLAIEPSGKLLDCLDRFISKADMVDMYISDSDLIKKMFEVISQFNTIPKESLCLMRKIVFAENWNNVTPLSKKERQEIELERITYEKNAYKGSWLGWIFGKVLGLDHIPWP